MKQTEFFPKGEKAYGGTLQKTRKGRQGSRPLATRSTMHLVLRSSKATGAWSFKHAQNAAKIRTLTFKFANKRGIKILSMANVGNHLHFHIRLSNRFTYKAFIRALTAAIAMVITGRSRWRAATQKIGKFWDYRPFTRILQSFREFLNLEDYVKINQLEGRGYDRKEACFEIAWNTATKRMRLAGAG